MKCSNIQKEAEFVDNEDTHWKSYLIFEKKNVGNYLSI